MEGAEQTKVQPNSMTIKLMVSKESGRIMYAEAGKELVDVLLSFLILPMGAIAKQALLTNKDCCIKNIYSSVENMSESVIKGNKEALLHPKVISNVYSSQILSIEPSVKYYVCYNVISNECRDVVSTRAKVRCPCGYSTHRQLDFVEGHTHSSTEGHVQKNANFVITDDLNITPIDSTATILQLWNKLQVQEPSQLEERNITFRSDEIIGMLKEAMVSNTALNEVFKAHISVYPNPSANTRSAKRKR